MSGAGKPLRRVVLTRRIVEDLTPMNEAYRVSDLRCAGLSVRVAITGRKTWDFAVRIRGAGIIKRKSLGSFPITTLELARERANNIARAAQAGRDLLDEERTAYAAAAARITIGALIEEYTKRATSRLRTAREIELRLKRALSGVASHQADTLKRRDLRLILEAVVDRGAPREAEKQRQSIGAMFSWAISQDYLDVNPAIGLKAFSVGNLRNRILTANEIQIFWRWLSAGDLTPDMADALRLQICLGTRIGEVAGIDAVEIDQANWIWTLPAARSKNKKPRVTPIVGIAKEMLMNRLTDNFRGPLFVNDTGKFLKSNDIGSAIVTRRKRIPLEHFVSHDLRRTVATELVNMGISFDVIAAVLGHENSDKHTKILTRHYVRTDQIDRKRVALVAWDKRLRSIIDGAADTSNVVQLRDILQTAV